MEHTSQYGSNIKHLVREGIYEHLYAPYNRYRCNTLEDIINSNCNKMRYQHKSFTYRGEEFSIDTIPAPKPANRLHQSFYSKMDEYLLERKDINSHELPYVLSFISQVLNKTLYFDDLLNCFPEFIHPALYLFKDLCLLSGSKLSDQEVQFMKQKNNKAIEMMKNRAVRNLLYQ